MNLEKESIQPGCMMQNHLKPLQEKNVLIKTRERTRVVFCCGGAKMSLEIKQWKDLKSDLTFGNSKCGVSTVLKD